MSTSKNIKELLIKASKGETTENLGKGSGYKVSKHSVYHTGQFKPVVSVGFNKIFINGNTVEKTDNLLLENVYKFATKTKREVVEVKN